MLARIGFVEGSSVSICSRMGSYGDNDYRPCGGKESLRELLVLNLQNIALGFQVI